jgi:hypothetical protein
MNIQILAKNPGIQVSTHTKLHYQKTANNNKKEKRIQK